MLLCRSAGAVPLEADRSRLNRILAVLRTAPGEASRSCLASMRDVHVLEQHPDGASDALEFSYQNAVQLCGADAGRVCREDNAPLRATVCARLDAER